jgi:hypothetical protein
VSNFVAGRLSFCLRCQKQQPPPMTKYFGKGVEIFPAVRAPTPLHTHWTFPIKKFLAFALLRLIVRETRRATERILFHSENNAYLRFTAFSQLIDSLVKVDAQLFASVVSCAMKYLSDCALAITKLSLNWIYSQGGEWEVFP